MILGDVFLIPISKNIANHLSTISNLSNYLEMPTIGNAI